MALFFFYIIGDLLANWWHNAWWVWVILGFSLIGAISTTLRFFASRFSDVSDVEYDSDIPTSVAITESVYQTEYSSKEQTSTAIRYCKNCGAAIEQPSQYCASCGEEI